jgi:hypothetical protein
MAQLKLPVPIGIFQREVGPVNICLECLHLAKLLPVAPVFTYPILNLEKYSVKNDIFWKVNAFKANHRIIQLLKLVNNHSN